MNNKNILTAITLGIIFSGCSYSDLSISSLTGENEVKEQTQPIKKGMVKTSKIKNKKEVIIVKKQKPKKEVLLENLRSRLLKYKNKTHLVDIREQLKSLSEQKEQKEQKEQAIINAKKNSILYWTIEDNVLKYGEDYYVAIPKEVTKEKIQEIIETNISSYYVDSKDFGIDEYKFKKEKTDLFTGTKDIFYNLRILENKEKYILKLSIKIEVQDEGFMPKIGEKDLLKEFKDYIAKIIKKGLKQ